MAHGGKRPSRAPLSAGASGMASVPGPGISPPWELSLPAPPWTRPGKETCRVPRTPRNRPNSFPRASLPKIPGGGVGRRGRPRRKALTRVRVEIEASHVLPGRQRAGQARSGQASGRSSAHAVAVHSQAGQQRRRGAVHGPRGPEVSAIHPPRECRSQPPTRPAGLAQRDLKVRPRRSPRVLGRRGLRGVHGGGGQRGLRSAAGPRPGAHGRPAVGPLRAARRSCARRRTRRLGGERPRAAEETEGGKRKREGGGKRQQSFRKSSCRSGSGNADLVARNKIGGNPSSTKSKNPCSLLRRPRFPGTRLGKWPVARCAPA